MLSRAVLGDIRRLPGPRAFAGGPTTQYIVYMEACRQRFTDEDFDFLASALGPGQRDTLEQLMIDPECRDVLLDDPRLRHALVEHERFCTSVRFYFYVFLRPLLCKQGVYDRGVADYLAEMLYLFAHSDNWKLFESDWRKPFHEINSLMVSAKEADDQSAYHLNIHLGNYALFVSGMFGDFLQSAQRRHQAPGLVFFEGTGSIGYMKAASTDQAKSRGSDRLLRQLSRDFRPMRFAIRDMLRTSG
jgi:hypothetical protein